MASIEKVKKRDGRIVAFDKQKIEQVILKAITATDQGDGKKSKELADKVVSLLTKRLKQGEIPEVEQIQDTVEEVLMVEGLTETAKAFILYREQRRKLREIEMAEEEAARRVDQYLEEIDWEVKENANMAYSLQGLNNYITSALIKRYWLEKIYPEEIREAVVSGDFHIHDLQTLGAYCCGWDLYDLLLRGFGGVSGKIQSTPPKHFRTALGQIVNFLYTLQGEIAGAIAFSNFDTLLAPFIRYDNLSYAQTKQAIQEFMFNANVPTRVGFQTPFENITLDIKPSPTFSKQPVIIGGKPQRETYGEFQEEMDMINRALYEVILEGDAQSRIFTFPIPTVNITKDFPWDKEELTPMWEATAKYGVNYFGNYINSEMKPEDVRSMCCRLRLDTKELYNRGGGGLFGAGSLTGSIGVVTINLPRIGYLARSPKEFLEKLEEMMNLAKESLEIKRKAVEKFTEKGLYPYCRYWLAGIKKIRGQYWGNHFSTIGLIGMNEACLNLLGQDIGTKAGRKFSLVVLDFMREKLIKYQEETGNLYNLEATPAEGTSYRLALMDKKKYPEIITAGSKEVAYYTNSTQLPVQYNHDVFEALELQDELQSKYTGGTVFHVFLGEQLADGETAKKLIKTIFEKFKLPYVSLTPVFSICPFHGYLAGEHFECPQCTIKQPCEVYSRIVGYYRPVKQWNQGKQQEFKERKAFKIRD